MSVSTPLKMNLKDSRLLKAPKPPEKPLMPYMRYSRKVWDQIKNSNPDLKLWEVGRIIGQMWRELPEDEKNIFIEEYEAEKVTYADLMRQYHASPAYQQWLIAKEREKYIEEEHERKATVKTRERDVASDYRESYILEDNEEDPDDYFTAKHAAASRFQRNHRLMHEILSDSKISQSSPLITEDRLNQLRDQVEQLRNHKRNISLDIENCESKHQAKIRRIKEESEKFYVQYASVIENRPMVSEAQFSEMLIKAKMDLTREEEEMRERHIADEKARLKRLQMKQLKETEVEKNKPVASAAPEPAPKATTPQLPPQTPTPHTQHHFPPASNGAPESKKAPEEGQKPEEKQPAAPTSVPHAQPPQQQYPGPMPYPQSGNYPPYGYPPNAPPYGPMRPGYPPSATTAYHGGWPQYPYGQQSQAQRYPMPPHPQGHYMPPPPYPHHPQVVFQIKNISVVLSE
ncbi:SWI SNF, matrix associated, actin dependent regulator of chromatin, subfamily e, member 1 [Cichlidogyrus casuarinus]|uniref:SWI SNF, matrix associated, actin dependent regulator of chromatin, subfamily e, member 1 n=1 Tax=Cichlidogyrus casuarinus TaxID=1844966 RepID=A0ABD2QC99_9PLAT